jgi:hypothetical protein
MLEGPHTYFDDLSQREDSRVTSLYRESERLGLDIEVYSTEIGVGFSEHYIISNGDEIVNEESDYAEYFYDGEYGKIGESEEQDAVIVAKFNEEWNTSFSINDYNGELESFIDGGFDNFNLTMDSRLFLYRRRFTYERSYWQLYHYLRRLSLYY